MGGCLAYKRRIAAPRFFVLAYKQFMTFLGLRVWSINDTLYTFLIQLAGQLIKMTCSFHQECTPPLEELGLKTIGSLIFPITGIYRHSLVNISIKFVRPFVEHEWRGRLN